jgi:hypothetical protein
MMEAGGCGEQHRLTLELRVGAERGCGGEGERDRRQDRGDPRALQQRPRSRTSGVDRSGLPVWANAYTAHRSSSPYEP